MTKIRIGLVRLPAEITREDMRIVVQPRRRSFNGNPAILHDVSVVRYAERPNNVLLDDQNGMAAVADPRYIPLNISRHRSS